MGFFAIFCAFAMRMCLSLTIPKMVKPIEHSQAFLDDSCPSPTYTVSLHNATVKNTTITGSETYDWSEYTQVSAKNICKNVLLAQWKFLSKFNAIT